MVLRMDNRARRSGYAAVVGSGKGDMKGDMKKESSELARWVSRVQEVDMESLPTINLPLYVLFGEAVDVVRFFKTYWKTEVDDQGNVTRLGLESAVPKGKKKGAGRLSAKTGREILSLQQAAQEGQTRYLLTVSPKSESPMERGQHLLGEISSALAWYFDDGIEDDKDGKLARLESAHADDAETQDALASALDDYAMLADQYRDALDGLGGFSAADIDEAQEVAAALRARPAQVVAVSEEARKALELRNKLAGLLLDRMNLVRAAARFVFRRRPEIVREATSAYERRKRAANRRAKKKGEEQPSADAG